MLHECQMEDYMETRLFFFNQLCGLLRSHRALKLDLVPAQGPVIVDSRVWTSGVNECWTAVWVAKQRVSVGDHFAVNCIFSFPGSGLHPCLVERGTDGVICSMLSSSWVTASLWITEYGYVRNVFFCLLQEHTLERPNNSYFSTVRLCMYSTTVIFLSCVSVFNVAFTFLMLSHHLIVDQYSVPQCSSLRLLLKTRLFIHSNGNSSRWIMQIFEMIQSVHIVCRTQLGLYIWWG